MNTSKFEKIKQPKKKSVLHELHIFDMYVSLFNFQHLILSVFTVSFGRQLPCSICLLYLYTCSTQYPSISMAICVCGFMSMYILLDSFLYLYTVTPMFYHEILFIHHHIHLRPLRH